MDHSFAKRMKRFEEKILRLKKQDPGFRVFGAAEHRYSLGHGVPPQKVEKFEKKIGVSLPAEYKGFFVSLGNASLFGSNVLAGPGYGLFNLGLGLRDLTGVEPVLNQVPGFCEKTTDAEWEEATSFLDRPNVDSVELNEMLARLLSGILPICHHGCGQFSALITAGKEAGKVIHLSSDFEKPIYTQLGFADWYEDWLDGSLAQSIQ